MEADHHGDDRHRRASRCCSRRTGLIPALIALVLIASLGGEEFKTDRGHRQHRRADDPLHPRLQDRARHEHLRHPAEFGEMDLLNNLSLGLTVARQLPEPALRPDRLHGRHADRRAARHRPRGDHRHAAADHLPPAADRVADHAGRHLLRRAVRRLDDVDPGQPAGRGVVGGHLHRRLPDGAQGPRRRRPFDLGGGLLLCRHRRHDHHRAVRRTADAHGAEIRPGRLLLADGARPGRRRGAGQRLGGQGDRHGLPRPAVRPGRHRRQHRRAALHLRHPRAQRRHRLRADRHGPVRHRRDRRQPRTTTCRTIRGHQGGLAVAHARGDPASHGRPSSAAPRLGSILGVLPGGGPTLGAFSAYTLEKKLSKTPERIRQGRGRGRGGAGSRPTMPRRRPRSFPC